MLQIHTFCTFKMPIEVYHVKYSKITYQVSYMRKQLTGF